MPRLVDSRSRSEAIAWGVARRIAESGLGAPSLRAIAAVCGVSPSGIVDQFGGRERMLEVTGIVLGQARVDDISRRHREGLLAFLPADDDRLVDTRVWLGVCELGRSHEDLGHKTRRFRDDERDLLRVWSGRDGGEELLDTTSALVDGLNVRVCDRIEPMPLERARQLARAWEERVLRPAS